jgi:IS5 family transposase
MEYVTNDSMSFFSAHDREIKLSQIGDPLERLSAVIDWEKFRDCLEKGLYQAPRTKGGRPPYDPVLMFKILVLAHYYNVADEALEYQILDRVSWQRFLGLSLADRVPDARTIWLFRENLTKLELIDKLFALFGKELEQRGVIGTTGKIVDASFVTAPKQRNTREENQQIKEDKVPAGWAEKPHKMRHKDLDARWSKKGNESFYGYKDHVKVDEKSKIINRYRVTAANVHDSQPLDDLVEEGDKQVHADSAYSSEKSEKILKAKEITAQINQKGAKHVELSEEEKKANREKSKVRVRVEHVFGFMTNTMKSLRLRSIGLARAKTFIGLMNLVYNLARFEQIMRLKIKIA